MIEHLRNHTKVISFSLLIVTSWFWQILHFYCKFSVHASLFAESISLISSGLMRFRVWIQKRLCLSCENIMCCVLQRSDQHSSINLSAQLQDILRRLDPWELDSDPDQDLSVWKATEIRVYAKFVAAFILETSFRAMGFWEIFQQPLVQVIYHLYRSWTPSCKTLLGETQVNYLYFESHNKAM